MTQHVPGVRGLAAVAVLVAAALVLPASPASAQYFGRNKVNYEKFDFRVLSTEHFDIHFYPRDNQAAQDAGRMAERWYARLSPTFDQTFQERKPIILYSNHADFQQTNAISGTLGEGTGGVTEPTKNRVVMPLTGDYAGTDHVLGHEIVHVFQFDIAFADEDTIPFRIQLLPLWLVEGMAEYLSVGRNDPHTAMWMRDAVLQDEFPTIKQLTTDSKFFPYRYGQALWAYVGGKWGDDRISEIYRASGRRGFEFALAKVLGVTSDSLSGMWADAVRAAYRPAMEGRAKYRETGTRILGDDIDSGEINLAPVLSPDGSQVAFLSERDLFSIDVFLADAKTGEIRRKLVSSATNSHFDALRFIDSAGTWSPDGKRFALVVFAKGDNEILVLDTGSAKIKERFRAPGVGAISNPVWSPDGTRIAFSGSAEGQSDLYLLDVATGAVTRLTEDRYADMQPAWSPDGTTLAFVTDRGPGTDFENLVYAPMRLGFLNVETREVRTRDVFPGAKHINPQYGPDGTSVFFISDPEGFSDVYRLDLARDEVYQVTRMATGVSGITAISPAITVSPATGDLLFSAFEEGKYPVYGLSAEQTLGTRVDPDTMRQVPEPLPEELEPEMPQFAGPRIGVPDGPRGPGGPHPDPSAQGKFPPTGGPREPSDTRNPGWEVVSDTTLAVQPKGISGPAPDSTLASAEADTDSLAGPADLPGVTWAGLLPPARARGRLVANYLADPERGLPRDEEFPVHKYKPKLQLDYVGGYAEGGIGTDRFGSAVGGEAIAYFSDMLGNHTVGVGLSANGSFKDIGAQAFYANRNQRWTWGAVVGHIPYLTIFSTLRSSGDTLIVEQFRDRTYIERGSLFAAYPFSPTRRFEIAAGFTRYSFDQEVTEQRLLPNNRVTEPTTSDLESEPGINLFQGSVALVGDNTFFGFTSPIRGSRYRFEVEPGFGSIQYNTLLLDYRRYHMVKPFTFAARAVHVGRYGRDAEDSRLNPLFIGYASLVRGYSSGSFDPTVECSERFGGDCAEYDRLLGSRIAVSNLEIRFPFIGTSQFGLIDFPYLPTELALFMDAGVAWDSESSPEFRFDTSSLDRVPVFSAGAAARINILGALILETYLAAPFQRPEKDLVFGAQIAPGW